MQLQTIHDQVREYYGKTLQGSNDLGTDAPHCESVAPPKYVLDVIGLIDDEVIERFYGCGSPIPPALAGATVLDLGCGTGRDAFILSKLVGEHGRVIGVDMTPEQLDVAKRHLDSHAQKFGYASSNVELKLGYIEDLAACGIEDESIDIVVSNCVVNLSPFKDLVMSEIHRVLKPGGELYFSDVYASRRLPQELRDDPVLHSECLGGATYAEDFRQLMRDAGWEHFVCTVDDPMYVGDLAIETRVGFTSFRSRTVRAIKCDGLEITEENYGQVATYLGGMPEMPRYFDFDTEQRFIKGKPRAVSGNTANMLSQSRYGRFFEITKPREHRGAFDSEKAQEALDVHNGRARVDVRMLQRAYDSMGYVTFDERVGEESLLQTKEDQSTMQVNVTYKCNLACRHCYLECTPRSEQQMSWETMQACLAAFETGGFKVMDITGGSPEMNGNLERFVRAASKLGDTIVRTNLTLLEQPEYAHLAGVFAECGTKLVASLPFYDSTSTDAQRGSKVFERAVSAIRMLNGLGYGKDGDLTLDLVYNVSGPFLPLPQDMIEAAYHKVLEREQGIAFNNLYAFNNWPLGRFAKDLLDSGMMDDYLALLADNFNALAVTRMMCLDQVTVDYDGRIYDCEVNHVLGLPIEHEGRDATVFDMEGGQLGNRRICTSPVCYSCAAGFGSSCGGSLV